MATTVLAATFVSAGAVGAGPASPRPPQPHKPASEAIVGWNDFAARTLLTAQIDPLNQSRILAMLHVAVHDALNAIRPRYASYTPGLGSVPHASAEAAMAATSRHVLIALLPSQQALIEAEYQRALAGIGGGPRKDAGVWLGEAAGAAILARRAADGIDEVQQPVYVPGNQPGDYQFTPPFTFGSLPGWGRLARFGSPGAGATLDGPDPLTSPLYAADFAFTKAIGRSDSAFRTPEQSEIAQFWYEDSPIGWNRIARTVVGQRRLDAWETARVLALVNIAMADGFIAGFEGKYRFRFWRPITAIRAAATDGNPGTEADATWEPFLVTPPVPDYPSTHTVLGAAAAEVLIALFGDREPYSMTSTSLPGVTRRFKGFSGAAMENGASRVFAGIHFIRAVVDGYQQGRDVGRSASRLLPAVK
jgi:hypothetical protein